MASLQEHLAAQWPTGVQAFPILKQWPNEGIDTVFEHTERHIGVVRDVFCRWAKKMSRRKKLGRRYGVQQSRCTVQGRDHSLVRRNSRSRATSLQHASTCSSETVSTARMPKSPLCALCLSLVSTSLRRRRSTLVAVEDCGTWWTVENCKYIIIEISSSEFPPYGALARGGGVN